MKKAALTKRQQLSMKRHKKHHSSKHMMFMESEMKKGMSFSKAHALAMRKVGK